MGTAAVLELILTLTQHAADLAAIYKTATAEGRDLTPAEVATFRTAAAAALASLQSA